MAKKKTDKTEEQFAVVEETLTRTEQWVENNQKTLSTIVFAIVGVIALYLAFDKFYVDPINEEAQQELFKSVSYFEADSFNLALNGVNGEYGLLDIIDDYGSTEAGNLANYYAGVCFLKTGDNESAIDYLSDFSSDDEVVSSVAYGSMGDAYMNTGEFDNAINYWTKAAFNSKNDFTTPIYLKRAAMALEEDGNLDRALEYYTIIQKEYSNSDEARDIDKFITRAQLKQ
jgi:tetratricopeptide (TPR) repeat protein|tara:strand:- start:339 stop:1025 length:687 start_codon:yes stop_codon:yes gene_type:complete